MGCTTVVIGGILFYYKTSHLKSLSVALMCTCGISVQSNDVLHIGDDNRHGVFGSSGCSTDGATIRRTSGAGHARI